MAIWHLLHFFDQEQPRKATVIRQILANRKTSSMLYWGLRYQILDYLNCFPQLKNEHYDRDIQQLVDQGDLIRDDHGYFLSDQGQDKFENNKTKYSLATLPNLNQQIDFQLWQAIMMILIQVASEHNHQNSNYYVASSNLKAQYFIKMWLHHYGYDELHQEINETLFEFLNQVDYDKANLFTAKLIGHGKNGLTNRQIATTLKIDEGDVAITWRDLCLQYADFLLHQQCHLAKIVELIRLPGIVTSTIRQTEIMFKNGHSVGQIIQQRHLRPSTIQDHLTILAISDAQFPFERILPEQDIIKLNSLYADQPNIDRWDFKKLEDEQAISFFKFRMFAIMKTHGEQHG